MFGGNDDSDGSEEGVHPLGPPRFTLRDEAPIADSNEGSSARAPPSTSAPAAALNTAGRPHRKSKSKSPNKFSMGMIAACGSQLNKLNP